MKACLSFNLATKGKDTETCEDYEYYDGEHGPCPSRDPIGSCERCGVDILKGEYYSYINGAVFCEQCHAIIERAARP